MKKDIFNKCIREILDITKKSCLNFEENTYEDNSMIPTYEDMTILSVFIDNSMVKVGCEKNGYLFVVDTDDMDEKYLDYLYEEIYDYNIGEHEYGTSEEFLDTVLIAYE